MKILILASNPRKDLNLEVEIRQLQGVIERSKNREQLEVEVGFAVRPEDLQGLLLKHEPEIVHFCGHGTGKQGLVLQDETGLGQLVSTDALSNLFELCAQWVQCVLLNACYSELQANAIIEHVNYAIGMNHEIRDDAAIAFATGFYQALGYGQSIEQSYKFGRNAIQLQISSHSNFRSDLSEGRRKLAVATTVEKVVIPEHLKPVLKIKRNLTTTIDRAALDESYNLSPSLKLDIQSYIDKALEQEGVLREDHPELPKDLEDVAKTKISSIVHVSPPKKTRPFFMGSIVTTLALAVGGAAIALMATIPKTEVLQVNAHSTIGTPFENPENKSIKVRFEADSGNRWLAIPENFNDVPEQAKGYLSPRGALNFAPNSTLCRAPLGALIAVGENRECKAYGEGGSFELEPGETAYFLMNDIDGFYQDNEGLIQVKVSINEMTTKDFLNRGADKHKQGDYRGAINYYNQAIQLNSHYADAYYDRGLAHYQLEEYEKVIADYTQVLALEPKNAQAYYNRGLAHYQLEDYSQALFDYNQAIQLDSKDADVYNDRGLTHYQLEDYPQAIADFTQVLILDPKNAQAHYNRSLTHYQLEDYEKAIDDYTQVITLDPKNAQAYYNRGLTHYQLEDYEKAIADYTQAIKLKPYSSLAYYHRGNIYFKQKEYQKAVKDYIQAIEFDQNWGEFSETYQGIISAYYNRGDARFALEEYQKAIADFTQAIEIDPDYAHAYYNRATAYLNLGENQKALENYQKAAKFYQQQGDTEWYQNALNKIEELKQ